MKPDVIASIGNMFKTFLTFFLFLLVLAIGCLDFFTDYDFFVSLLYLVPVILTAWFEGGVPATVISIFCALTWAVADLVSGHIYFQRNIAIRNAFMVLALFLIVAYFIVVIKKVSAKERHS